ncbi:fibroblast growth factor binding protein 2a [Alosa sapidissima]|uniref:fibroblast growth factor binding protein 2a n=1 Tax=Alosa sapidissima TaxID=34773 RepID=UPI001C0839B4|nr:fibroblast growth factor binding protein 2a [Alosa sapidissima]
MRTGLLLLVACCLWAAEGQTGSQRGRSIWDDPVTFLTKDKDACAMHLTGQGDMTTLRVDCQGAERSYWCDYRGKPQTCRTYNNNPRHYFTQIMWDLRKLHHACSGPIVFKPQMCKKASDEARMVFVGASSDDGTGTAAASPERQEKPSRPTQSRPEATRPERPQAYRPTRPQPARPTKPDQAKSESRNNNNNLRKPSTSKPSTPSPTQSTSKIQARKMAQDYCWRSMTGVCAYVIGLFRN